MRRRFHMDIAAMSAGDIAGNGETQTGAPSFRIARLVQAEKGPKYRLTHVFVDAWSIVINRDFKRTFVFVSTNFYIRLSKFLRVVGVRDGVIYKVKGATYESISSQWYS